MSEIEFRGQRVDTKEWVYGNLVVLQHEDGKAYYIIPFLTNGVIQKELMLKWISPCFEVIPETVGQYTGLKGKNGKEIYEGDIVKDEGGLYGNVIYSSEQYDGIAGFMVFDIYDGLQNKDGFWHLCEIIGNIYENQELMKRE